MAFTKKIRMVIKARAGNKSEVSGVKYEPLQAAHINHKRKTGYYNCPTNGVLMTVAEHLMDHVLREGENGLTKAQNFYAISSLSRQVEIVYGKERMFYILEMCEDPLKHGWWLDLLSKVKGEKV